MIQMRQYEGSVEDRYWECVNKEIDLSVQQGYYSQPILITKRYSI